MPKLYRAFSIIFVLWAFSELALSTSLNRLQDVLIALELETHNLTLYAYRLNTAPDWQTLQPSPTFQTNQTSINLSHTVDGTSRVPSSKPTANIIDLLDLTYTPKSISTAIPNTIQSQQDTSTDAASFASYAETIFVPQDTDPFSTNTNLTHLPISKSSY